MNTIATEQLRLQSADSGTEPWRFWGPYLSERQWGTVREDYSPHGNAWEYFPHDHARSRAYRWGEDGLAGFSDEQARLCLALALWNGVDPILKERLFGLTNGEGNHGEDVKEVYYYQDATPTHSWLRMLYKYPQREFPYAALVAENAARKRDPHLPEYELLDTGIFDDDRYWDVTVEYAKAAPEDVGMRITVHNRGPETATIHVLPQLWFRNTWAWASGSAKPELRAVAPSRVRASHPELGEYRFEVEGTPSLLFAENETNANRLYGAENPGWFKDAFHERVIRGNRGAVNPAEEGTKAAAWYVLEVPSGASRSVRVRLRKTEPASANVDGGATAGDGPIRVEAFDAWFALRREEADAFYRELQRDIASPDERHVQRQALAGMIWSKQFFHFDVRDWLAGDPAQIRPPSDRKRGRNHEWDHLNTADVLSMPDKWEYPWFAAWDLAFHAIPLALVDPRFAKDQLVLLTREWYMHPNGQIPAYEWAFGDTNPPVHAWAAWRVFQIDRKQRRVLHPSDPGDLRFLERVFHKLLLNFTWWVNRKDARGRNIFQGGFLGLDNIGCFDRSAPLPTGGFINQADGTSWMAMYSLNLMRIALELARHNPIYQDIATKFFEHFLHIAAAINGVGEGALGLWDEEDSFYYDQICLPDGRCLPLEIRSMVGLIPLFAVETLEPDLLDALPEFKERLEWFLAHRPDLAGLVSRWDKPGLGGRYLLSLLRGHRMKCLLRRMLDPEEFLSEFGVRAVSRYHRDHPYRFAAGGAAHEVAYWPGESRNGLFGGNSNWRGPVWMPVNYLLVESLQKFHHYYGDDFRVECPTGSGRFLSLEGIADDLSYRLARLFLADDDHRRPVLGYHPKLANDPAFRDHVLFHEYFHGDSGRGVGASHQTGWSGLVAKLLHPRRHPPEPPIAAPVAARRNGRPKGLRVARATKGA
ncbi:MAG: glucosidase [Verrucomicrobiales bacterium]|nr:glucosidase [Verrucomicrobiales bacterium]